MMNSIPPDHKSPLMCMIGMAASVLLPFSAMADINSTFITPPYTLNGTVVGIEGWEMLHKEPYPVYTDPDGAKVIDSPVSGSTQPSTLNLETLLKGRPIEDLGDQFVVEVQFAVAFNPTSSFDGGLYFRFARTDAASPFHFGFYYGEGGGLYFQGGGGRVILLPKAEIQQGGAYKFVIQVNRSTQTFSITVTCANDASFRYESKDVAFQDQSSATDKFKEFFMGNNKPTTTKAYIDYVKVTPSLE